MQYSHLLVHAPDYEVISFRNNIMEFIGRIRCHLYKGYDELECMYENDSLKNTKIIFLSVPGEP